MGATNECPKGGQRGDGKEETEERRKEKTEVRKRHRPSGRDATCAFWLLASTHSEDTAQHKTHITYTFPAQPIVHKSIHLHM